MDQEGVTHRGAATRFTLLAGSATLVLALALMFYSPVATANARRESLVREPALILATVQLTPTPDATLTALQKRQIAQQIDEQKHTLPNWLWSLVTTSLSTLALVVGGFLALFRWLGDRSDERRKQAEERFKSIVDGLGAKNDETKIASAVLLRTFLRPEYSAFYTQVFDLSVARLRMHEREGGTESSTSEAKDSANVVKRPDSLHQVFITLFKESFPVTRDWLRSRNAWKLPFVRLFERLFRDSRVRERLATAKSSLEFEPRILDATGVRLDGAFLVGADLRSAWMPHASLKGANLEAARLDHAQLEGADLTDSKLGGASLTWAGLNGATLKNAKLDNADLTDARLIEAILEGATLLNADLTRAKLNGAHLEGAEYNDDTIWTDAENADRSKAINVTPTGAPAENGAVENKAESGAT